MESKQNHDELRRELEKNLAAAQEAFNEAEKLLNEKAGVETEKRDKIRAKGEEIQKRLDGFHAYVEHAKSAGVHYDEERAKNYIAARQAEIDAVSKELVEFLTDANKRLEPFAKELNALNVKLVEVQRLIAGQEEYERMLKESTS